jgi:3-keto-5-aminohexanoate cleavage enzyme
MPCKRRGFGVEKLIIYLAVGYPGYARPELPAIPKSWDDLVEQIVAGREAGASIVQFRGPDVEGHIAADRWGRLVEQVRRHSDILISFGQAGPPFRKRKALLELGTANPDIMAVSLTNHDFHRGPDRPQTDVYYTHARAELYDYAQALRAAKVKPAWEVWHAGGVWTLNHLVERGLIDAPHLLTLIFGAPGSTWSPATVEEVAHRVRLLPTDSRHLVGTLGCEPQAQMPLIAHAIVTGGHVRLGGQDTPYYLDGVPATSNAQLVERAVRIAREIGRGIATPAETRRILAMTDPRS